MRDRIAKIEVETGHLVQMVNELLDLVRIESGGTLQLVDGVDMGRLAADSAERLRLFAERQGVTLRIETPDRPAAGPRRRRAARPGRRQPRPQRREVQPGRRRHHRSARSADGRRGRRPRSRITASASRAAPRTGCSSGSTRSIGRGCARRPAAGPGWAWRSRGTSSSSTAGASGSSRRRASDRPSRSPCRSRTAAIPVGPG